MLREVLGAMYKYVRLATLLAGAEGDSLVEAG